MRRMISEGVQAWMRVLVCGWLAMVLLPSLGSAQDTKIEAVAGQPVLLLGNFDLGSLGYRTEEFFISGTASAYKLAEAATADGEWNALPADKAPYVTRIVTVRPVDPRKFNGTVVVEWLNVSAGTDAAPDWTMTHRELLRSGYAYVAVSAQRAGIDGVGAPPGLAVGTPLKKQSPERYALLEHPGDSYSYDIYSQAGKLVRTATRKILGPLVPQRVLAIGESQSAAFLTTYINAIDPLARVYDAFLVHSRFGGAASLQAASMMGGPNQPRAIKFRRDLRVPLLAVETETDVLDGVLPGYHSARQPDHDKLRVWEVPGTAHADNYSFMVGMLDSPSNPLATLAAAWAPSNEIFGAKLAKPINNAPQHHYVVQNALACLDLWIRKGQAPPHAEPMQTQPNADTSVAFVADAQGLTQGGVRTPWVDVPVSKLSGSGNAGGGFAFLVGVSEPFDTEKLDRLYPGGKPEYLQKFAAVLDSAIKAGFILRADREEIIGLAGLGYHGSEKVSAPPVQ